MIRLGDDGYVFVDTGTTFKREHPDKHLKLMLRPPTTEQPKRPKFYAEGNLDRQAVIDLIEELKATLHEIP